MTNKKRKACSPTQEGQHDVCAELKAFIVRENEKCVKEIKDSNDRRMVAVEESLSFAMDSLSAVSNRQQSADLDILELQKETADLRQRLQQIELCEDHRQQEKRLTTLIFSGPALQALSRREDAAELIRFTVEQYMRHSLDRTQVKAQFRLKNGKVLTEFTSAALGSDRDILFRSKSKLRGSGLYVSESLTPRRQAMFADLLWLKKEGVIFSVFTRSGDILACRSRDSAPLRIASPEAVRCLSESGAQYRPAQGRAQARDGGGRTDYAAERGVQRHTREVGAIAPPGIIGDMEVDARGPAVSPGPSHRGSYSGPRRGGAASGAEIISQASTERRDRPESSLLGCARETVHLVHLSPPLRETPPASVTTDRSAGGDESAGAAAAAASRGSESAPLGGRRAAAQLPGAGGLESPLPDTLEVSPPSLTAAASGGRGGQREDSVSAKNPGLPSVGLPGRLTGSQSGAGGVGGVSCPPGFARGASVVGMGEERGAVGELLPEQLISETRRVPPDRVEEARARQGARETSEITSSVGV